MAISGFCRQISFRNAHFFEQRFYFFKFFRIHRFRGNVRPQKFEKLFFTGADIVAVAEIEIKMNGRSGKIKHRIDPLIKVVCTEYGFNDVTLTAHLTNRTCHNGFGGFTVTVDFSLRPRFVLVITVNITGMVFYFYYNNVPVAHYK